MSLIEAAVNMASPNPSSQATQPEGLSEQQTKLPEPSTENLPPVAPVDEGVDFASKFAALTRKEKLLVRKAKESEEKYGKVVEYEKAIAEARKNPIKFLEAAGLSYQQITDYILNDGKPTIENQLEELRLKYETDAANRQKEKEESELQKKSQDDKHYQEIIDNHKKQIVAFLDGNRDVYELCAVNGASEDIFEVIEEYYKANNEVLSIDKAAEAVEKYLESEAEKVFSTKKFQSKRLPQENGQKTTAPGVSKTITNNVGEFSISDSSHLNDEESKALAAKLIRWT